MVSCSGTKEHETKKANHNLNRTKEGRMHVVLYSYSYVQWKNWYSTQKRKGKKKKKKGKKRV